MKNNRVITYIGLFVVLLLSCFLLRDSTWQGSTQLHTLMEIVSALLWLSWVAWKREARMEEPGRISQQWIYGVAGGLTLASFFFFAFVPLPKAYYAELFFQRPEEFVPGLFFLLALTVYLRKGRWKHDTFEHWLVFH